MYFVTLGLLAWWDMDAASWGWRGRTIRRAVEKIGAGIGESGVVAVAMDGFACAEISDVIAAGCAGVGCAAMVDGFVFIFLFGIEVCAIGPLMVGGINQGDCLS